MASRKKSDRGGAGEPIEGPSADARAFTVAVEQMQSQFKVFGEALLGLTEEVRTGFARVDARFEQVDARFDRIDARFEQVDARFEQVEGRLDHLDREVGLVKVAVLENARDIRDVKTSLARLEGSFDARVEAIVDRKLALR